MNVWDYIILAAVLGAAAAAVVYIFVSKRRGKSVSCGCGCNGDCSSCGLLVQKGAEKTAGGAENNKTEG